MFCGRSGWSSPSRLYVPESKRLGEALRQNCKGNPLFLPGEGKMLLLLFSDRSGGGARGMGWGGVLVSSCQPGAKSHVLICSSKDDTSRNTALISITT